MLHAPDATSSYRRDVPAVRDLAPRLAQPDIVCTRIALHQSSVVVEAERPLYPLPQPRARLSRQVRASVCGSHGGGGVAAAVACMRRVKLCTGRRLTTDLHGTSPAAEDVQRDTDGVGIGPRIRRANNEDNHFLRPLPRRRRRGGDKM